MDLTEEQLAVADAQVGVNSFIRIEARAGTGKTTSFVEYALRNHVPMLYLAFNKSVEVAAQGKFPSHVKCKTVNSLAYQAVGVKYGKPASSVRYYEVQKCFKVDVYAATLICKTLENFLNSADAAMGVQHAEPDWKHRFKEDPRPKLVVCANDLWARLCSGQDQRFPMTHNGYLKLYQLSKPRIYEKTIMLDEAQDTNPVTFDILEQQRRNGARILVCGDPFQQIYSWRGAKNAMEFEPVASSETLYLTQSFRFGTEVARVANSLLLSFFPHCIPVLGHPQIYDELTNEFPNNESFTVIARSNAEIFEQAATWTSRKKTVHFIGDAKFSLLVDGVLDVYSIFIGARASVKDKSLAFMRDFYVLKAFAEDRMDNELLSKIDIVDRHKTAIPSLVEQIKRATVSEQVANVILVTAHKAKGLEWDNVYLTNDFFELFNRDNGGLKALRDLVEAQIEEGFYDHGNDDFNPSFGQDDDDGEGDDEKQAEYAKLNPAIKRAHRIKKALFNSIHRDEVHLLYVAATRAKKRLRINSELHKLLGYATARNLLNQPAPPPPAPKPAVATRKGIVYSPLPAVPTRRTVPSLVPRKMRAAPPASILDGLDEEVQQSKRYGRTEEEEEY